MPSEWRSAGSVKGRGHGTLLGRVTLILSRYGLLPKSRFGGLGANVQTPFHGGGSALEVRSKVVIPGRILRPAFQNTGGAAPKGWGTGSGDASRAVFLDLVRVPVEVPLITLHHSTHRGHLCPGCRAAQSQTSPIQLGVRRRLTIHHLAVFLDMPNVVSVRDGHRVGTGLSRYSVKNYHGIAIAPIGKARERIGSSGQLSWADAIALAVPGAP